MEMPELHLEKVKENPLCFGCGKDNPHSLKLRKFQEGEKTQCEFVPNEYHQSWPGHVHGGALMAALDEGIAWDLFSKGIYAVTAKIEVQLKSMARIGEPLIVSGWIVKQTSRLVESKGEIRRKDDSLVAEATALLYIVK